MDIWISTFTTDPILGPVQTTIIGAHETPEGAVKQCEAWCEVNNARAWGWVFMETSVSSMAYAPDKPGTLICQKFELGTEG
jgi:hypothetical protein